MISIFYTSIMYIKIIHFGATWHNFNPLIATWQFNTPLNIDLSGNILLTRLFLPQYDSQTLIHQSALFSSLGFFLCKFVFH
ncbi:hypothetical protein Hanom_Chr09g00803521 [Helianthus anomalus]